MGRITQLDKKIVNAKWLNKILEWAQIQRKSTYHDNPQREVS